MAATATKEDDGVRHVAQDTLNSLNLKIDNNLNEYIVLIVNIHYDQSLLTNLPMMISKDRIQAFNDVKACLTFIQSLCNTNIFLIISGTLGQNYADRFISERQILGLYIYCMDKDKHKMWTKGIQKIRCTVSNPTQLLTRLHADIRELSGRWPIGEKSFQKALTTTSQWYHLFLLVICYRSQQIKNSYDEMFNECRAYYKNDPHMIKKINKFQQTYKSDNAIREYTRDTFLYRIVNHALRTQNMENIRKFSPFISDLHSQIHDYHEKYYISKEQSIRAVYRGQNLSLDELEYLSSICKSRSPVITMTTFTSTSLDPEVALNFAFAVDNRIPCLFEIIIPDDYNVQHIHMPAHEQAFANIASLSVIKDEQEVLFSLVTHFRVKHVEYPGNMFYRSWASVTLELISDRKGECSTSYFDIVGRLKKEKDPKIYSDILHMMQINAENELKFKDTNWQKWWSKLSYQWGTHTVSDQSLLLMFYDSFTDDLYWSRKAIEMHKDTLHTNLEIQSNLSFSYLSEKFNAWQKIPTRWIALYEEYLKQFCTTNTKEVIKCLWFAGETYEMIADKDSALECYQKACELDVNDSYQMKNKIQNRIQKLTKSFKTSRTVEDERRAVPDNTDNEFSRMYEAQEEQWSIYWTLKSDMKGRTTGKLSIKLRLTRLLRYLEKREEWYDAADSKIVLRLPYGDTEELLIDNYRSYFLSAVHTYVSTSIKDATNHRSLSIWRYEKYMREWNLFKELEKFLKPFQEKSRLIRFQILPQLDKLIGKLSVLITLCTVYICIQRSDGEIYMSNAGFIDKMDVKARQLIFFDLRDNNLLTDLETLAEESSIIQDTPSTTEESWETIEDFMRQCV